MTAESTDDTLSIADELLALKFGVRRSCRYHDRRRAYFDTLHKITNVLTILLAGSVVFSIAHEGSKDPSWLIGIALLASLLSAVDLVVGYAQKANLHRELKIRFAQLEIDILTGGEDKAALREFTKARLTIEKDEPPVYRALDILCQNELLIADGYEGEEYEELMGRLASFERMTAYVFRWSDVAAVQQARRDKAKEKAEKKAAKKAAKKLPPDAEQKTVTT
nr:MAG TPA: SMODS and SLOG-associating 2TM effector domain family 4 [Caudoviricetes sp.]